MSLNKEQIAKRISKELRNNTYVNLGIGIPTLVANYIIDRTFGIKSKYYWENN